MTVILSEYKKDEYQVVKDGVLKCKHKSEDKARAFAAQLSGSDDYVDQTVDQTVEKAVEKKKPKKNASKE